MAVIADGWELTGNQSLGLVDWKHILTVALGKVDTEKGNGTPKLQRTAGTSHSHDCKSADYDFR